MIKINNKKIIKKIKDQKKELLMMMMKSWKKSIKTRKLYK